MNSLLNKFVNVKIENTERVSQEDKEFCIKMQDQYIQAVTPITNCLKELADMTGVKIFEEKCYSDKSNNTFIDWYKMKDIKEVATHLKNSFMNKIIYHFSEKYQVTIKNDFINKYAFNITYEEILSEIFEQLGGYTFEEKGTLEIKNKLKENTKQYRGDKEKVKVSKTKISIDSYVYIDTWDAKWGGSPRVHYSSQDKLEDILKGLKHYSEGSTSLTQEEMKFIREDLRENIGDYKELSYVKINNIKIFKNGKCEINFVSSQDALNFAKEYLSLTKVA
jgi:hypothetical protein